MTAAQMTPSVAGTSLPRMLASRWPGHLRKLVLECRARPCRRFTVSHRLLRRDGIYLGDAWHCSAACFEVSLRSRLAAAAGGCVEPPPRTGRIPFRLILLERGVLSEAQLRESLRLQSGSGGRLEDILVAEGFASEVDIASAKAAEAGCAALLRLPSSAPSVQLPRGLMERYRAAIVHASETSLLLGFARQLSPALHAAVEQITGIRPEVCVLPESMLGPLLDPAAAASSLGPRSMPTMRPSSTALRTSRSKSSSVFPADAARGMLRQAIDAGSERVLMATGDRWAWVRLSGAQELDFFLPLRAGGSS